MAETKDETPKDSEGFPIIDPTDHDTFAALIEQHGLDAVREARQRQVGSTVTETTAVARKR